MGNFARFGNPFRKSGSTPTQPLRETISRFGSPFRTKPDPTFPPVPYPTPPNYPTEQSSSFTVDPHPKPAFSRDRVIAASVGAAVLAGIGLVGIAVAVGTDDAAPTPAAAITAPEPDFAPREEVPQPQPVAQLPVDESAIAPALAGEPEPVPFAEPVPAKPAEAAEAAEAGPPPAPFVDPAPPPPAEPAPAPAPAPAPMAEPAPAAQPVQDIAPPPSSTHYKNCDAVRAAGAAPIYQGTPGYAKHLDRDGDGIGCDT